MKSFLEEIEKNPELKARIEELDKNPESTPKDFIKAAAEYGVELKEEDFQPAGAREELKDDELDAVAGGETCTCALFGGGVWDEYHEECMCIKTGAGAGQLGYLGCWCVLSGSGDTEKNRA